MQPLEYHEDALEVLPLDADAVVGDREAPLALLLLHADVDAQRLVRLPELDRVADQVLEELSELRVVRADLGQIVVGDLGVARLDGRAQIDERAVERLPR